MMMMIFSTMRQHLRLCGHLFPCASTHVPVICWSPHLSSCPFAWQYVRLHVFLYTCRACLFVSLPVYLYMHPTSALVCPSFCPFVCSLGYLCPCMPSLLCVLPLILQPFVCLPPHPPACLSAPPHVLLCRRLPSRSFIRHLSTRQPICPFVHVSPLVEPPTCTNVSLCPGNPPRLCPACSVCPPSCPSSVCLYMSVGSPASPPSCSSVRPCVQLCIWLLTYTCPSTVQTTCQHLCLSTHLPVCPSALHALALLCATSASYYLKQSHVMHITVMYKDKFMCHNNHYPILCHLQGDFQLPLSFVNRLRHNESLSYCKFPNLITPPNPFFHCCLFHFELSCYTSYRYH
nr:uncharacterized protein LOC126540205 [Dermacentor andersoni]XP_054931845.1 uncharacterized protein LOC126540205 [Dermacentor andersoni]XP_054931846.1 uncharacterized protein LOC126540205 [Dermacentor andersoni]XP_054931847.1 uncharacterized protein LOC126540205 [Dermacentor andersoni]